VNLVYDAIVLAGASSRRLDGADKAAVDLDGTSLLDRVLAAANDAQRIVVVGPARQISTHVRGELIWTSEQPAGSGPVAAIAAGLAEVRAAWCLVLATDLPFVAAAVPLLLTAAVHADVAVLSSGERRNYLAAVWRTDALRAAVDALDSVEGAAARSLFAGRDVVDVPDENGWGRDLDTWDDVERARHG
jgi:molybdopterin-guanine dinucleotide biosynthesis protein A